MDDGGLSPRPYQEMIVKEAVDKNVLVVLPTGLGKTLVSALVCSRLLDDNPRTKALVMAPTRPLVAQHRESFIEVLDLHDDALVTMTGHVQPRARERLWQEGTVFFTTPQIVENDLSKGRLSLADFSLVVFDEAHRAVKDYAYTKIARHYMEEGAYPIILGLTASPGGNRERVQEVCETLAIEKIIYRTHEDEDISPFVHRIETEWREVDLPREYRSIRALLKQMLDDRLAKLRAHGPFPGRYIGKSQMLALGQRLRDKLKGAGPSERGRLFGAMMHQSACLSILHAIELLESQGIRPLLRFLNKVEDEKDTKRPYKNLVKDPLFKEVMRKVGDNIGLDHPKVDALKMEVVREVSRSKKAKVLVFTQYRDTATILVNALRNDVFLVERFVGQGSRLGDDGLDQREQAELLDRFREGEITVLVATSVAEEGLDIPNVDLVVFYEPVPSEIRFIQRKGRTGRKRVGRVLLLATRDSVDTGAHYASQRKIQRMKEIMGSIDATLERVPRGERPKAAQVRTPSTKVGPVPAQARPSTRTTILGITERPSTGGPSNPVVKGENELVRQFIMERLEQTGEMSLEDLYEEGNEAGLERALLKKGIDVLTTEGAVFRPSWDMIRRVQGGRGDAPTEEKDVYSVTVKKVFQGGAILVLDQGEQLLLEPEDFPESPIHIKKGRRFRAKGTIYELRGKRHLRVLEVLD
jgi:Fanconi anemia group M protein